MSHDQRVPHWKDKPTLAAPLISCLNSASDPTAAAASLIYKEPEGFAFVIILWDPICSGREEGEVGWNFVDADEDLTVFSFVFFQGCSGGHLSSPSSWIPQVVVNKICWACDSRRASLIALIATQPCRYYCAIINHEPVGCSCCTSSDDTWC